MVVMGKKKKRTSRAKKDRDTGDCQTNDKCYKGIASLVRTRAFLKKKKNGLGRRAISTIER